MVGRYRGLFAELFWAGGAGDIPSDSNVGGDVLRLFHLTFLLTKSLSDFSKSSKEERPFKYVTISDALTSNILL